MNWEDADQSSFDRKLFATIGLTGRGKIWQPLQNVDQTITLLLLLGHCSNIG
jgi:hypothetical protein